MKRYLDTNFSLNYTNQAVFEPGESPAFSHYRQSWLDSLKNDSVALIDWWAANLCILSYRNELAIKEALQGKGEFLESFQGGTQYAFAAKIGDLTFLVIQGSANPADSILNMKIFKKKEEGVFYHGGFLEATDFIWSGISQFIHARKEKVIVCGHSLGGAIGQVISSRIEIDHLVTFGAPRIGEARAQERARGKHRRYVNCCDGVPMLPPAILGFRHMGQLIFINDGQQLQDQLSFKARALASMSYFYSFKWCQRKLALNRLLSDHSPINYCMALSRHLIENGLEK